MEEITLEKAGINDCAHIYEMRSEAYSSVYKKYQGKDVKPFAESLAKIIECMLTFGINHTTAANASLLNNFEIVATAIIALCLFKETISKKLWIAITLITIASLILSFEDMSSLSFSLGSIFVLLSCVGWGFENNCTRQISGKDPLQIVAIKGCCSGTVTMIIALVSGERMNNSVYFIAALLLGFVSFGLSNFFYIFAQRKLGAAKTSAYYAISPFIGTLLSFIIFKQVPTIPFLIALVIMLAGAYLAA